MSVPLGNVPLYPLTPPAGDNSKLGATTEYVDRAVAAALSAGATLQIANALAELSLVGAIAQANALQNIGALTPGQVLALALTN